MQTPDDVVASFRALRPLRFDELERFELSYPLPPTTDRSVSALTIVLRPSPHVAAPKLVITCTGIAQLHLEAESCTYLSQLEVQSIAERQWEHLHYFVQDVEDENSASIATRSRRPSWTVQMALGDLTQCDCEPRGDALCTPTVFADEIEANARRT